MLSIGRASYPFIGVLLALTLFQSTKALASGLMILYPEVREPYSKVYQDIINGIKSSYTGHITEIPLTDRQGEDRYITAVRSNKPDKIIALGRSALNLATRITPEIPTIVGATSATNLDLTGVSMIPDPAVVIARLHKLDNSLSSIHVVTNPKTKQRQLKAAKDYAHAKNINFVVHEAKSVKAAAGQYRVLLNSLGKHDSIWLLQDQALSDTSLLSLILEIAWDRKIIVFSLNPTHVKRGALFSVYPNNVALGTRLGEIASNHNFNVNSGQKIEFLQNVLIAGNERTLRHLGLTEANQAHQVFDSTL